MTKRLFPPHHRAVPVRMPDAEIERRLFEAIDTHFAHPSPVIEWLTDRMASHDIVRRLQLLPARAGTLADTPS
jgi:hypothetical protein